MNTDEITAKVKEIIHEQCFGSPSGAEATLPELTPETKIDTNAELGLDSLDMVEIVMSVEEEFDIEITDDEAAKFHQLKDIVGFVESKTK